MRQLTNSERRLALIFLALVFVVANAFAVNFLNKQKKLLQKKLVALRLEQLEARAWLADGDLWLKRKAWLDEKQPKSQTDGQESAKLLESLQQGARQQNITIGSQQLKDPRTTAYYREVAVQLEVKGRLDSVSKWLAGLQDPERFQAITSLTLKSDAEPPKVICTLTVARWYALP